MTFSVLPTRAPGCASDLDLDELLSGDLAGLPREAALRGHVDGCARCRERLAAFAAVEPPPAATLLPRVARTGATPLRRMRWPLTALVVATGAAAMLVVLVRRSPGPDPVPDDRVKGGLAFAVVVKRAEGAIETITHDGVLRAGDEMRFSLASAKPGYAVVLGLDAVPSVTVYAPASAAAQPIRIDAAGANTLPGSIVADETAGVERVVAVVCDAATQPEALRAQAAAALAAAAGHPERVSSLGTGCLESWVLMRKEPPAR